jgi:hypothetical protein
MARGVRRFVVAAVAALIVGCSDGGSDDRTVDPVAATSDAGSGSTDQLLVPVTGEVEDLDTVAVVAGSDQVDDAIDSTAGPVESIDPVSDTGVPGIDSADDFCRSWSEYAGSYQAITFGWAFRDPVDAATLEVSASATLIAGAAGMAASLPVELEAERDALTVDLVSPLLRRAARSADYLASQDVSPAALDELRAAWLDTLTASGTDDLEMAVVVPGAVGADRVEAAAEKLVAELPPIVEDPSLIVDVQIPATEAYLAENCPDQGVLLGNDVVEL